MFIKLLTSTISEDSKDEFMNSDDNMTTINEHFRQINDTSLLLPPTSSLALSLRSFCFAIKYSPTYLSTLDWSKQVASYGK